MNKICVILTGGTIGSRTDGNVVSLMKDDKGLLIDTYKRRYGSSVDFDVLSPLNILSENVRFSDIRHMADCVKNVADSGYDGIIVTHGTDTLCFTANLFSQIFRDIKVPLVFVSALYPLGHERSFGVENFAGAVDFIVRERLRGVFVSFKNERENLKIHLASRLEFTDQITGKFESVLDLPLCRLIDGKFVYPDEMLAVKARLNDAREPYGKYRLCKDVVTIRARAFLDFDFYKFGENKPRAVIIELYHSGTICTRGEETNALRFIDYCNRQGVQVVLSPVDSSASVYSSALKLKDNCIIAYDMSFEMTVVKVMLALGGGKDLKTELESNNFFEKIY